MVWIFFISKTYFLKIARNSVKEHAQAWIDFIQYLIQSVQDLSGIEWLPFDSPFSVGQRQQGEKSYKESCKIHAG